MLEHFLYILPLLILLGGISILAFKKYETGTTSQCFKLSRLILIISFVLSIIFYNRPMLINISSANYLTLIFICWLFISAFIVLYLAQKWFSTMQQSGVSFCRPLITAVAAGCLLIISKNMILTTMALVLLIFTNCCMLLQCNENKYCQHQKNMPLNLSYFFAILLILITCGFYNYFGSADYIVLQTALAQNQNNMMTFLAVCGFILCFMFILAVAPLHYWLIKISAQIGLPILTYFMLIPTTLCLIGLTHLNVTIFLPFNNYLRLFYIGIGMMSVFVGAVSACSYTNIRQILVCSVVYNIGVIFLILQHLSCSGMQTALIYWLICWLAYAGICISLFCFKSKGEYLFTIDQFVNAAYHKPYATLLLTLFLFSLLGLPPLTGSLGLFYILSELAAYNHFYLIIYVLMMLIIISYAYLHFIQKLYFSDNHHTFDRTGADLHLFLFIIAAAMFFIILQPHYMIDYPWLKELIHG